MSACGACILEAWTDLDYSPPLLALRPCDLHLQKQVSKNAAKQSTFQVVHLEIIQISYTELDYILPILNLEVRNPSRIT